MTLHRKKPKMARAAWRISYMRPLRPQQMDEAITTILRIDASLERWHKAVKP